MHKSAHHTENDEHRRSPLNEWGGGETHHQRNNGRRRKRRRHRRRGQKGQEERREDIPHVEERVRRVDERLITKAGETVVVKRPSKGRKHGLCQACAKIITDLARKQGQKKENSGRPIVIHLMRKPRQHRKKRAPVENSLQDMSCKQ